MTEASTHLEAQQNLVLRRLLDPEQQEHPDLNRAVSPRSGRVSRSDTRSIFARAAQ